MSLFTSEIKTLPVFGFKSPVRTLNKVDFPLPDLPMTAIVWPNTPLLDITSFSQIFISLIIV